MSAVGAEAANDIRSKVKGKWEITIPDAPSGYQNYDLDVKEKDGTVVIDVKGGDINIKEQKFTEKDGKLSANLYVGEYVKVTIWEEKGVIKGAADTSMGKLPCNFKKPAKHKEK
jgi:major membrane immunogen (membrane-anchored lipoprotein)